MTLHPILLWWCCEPLHLLATPTAHGAPADGGFRVSSVQNHLQPSKRCELLINSEGGFVAVLLGLKIKHGRGQCGERKYSYETDCSHRGVRGCECLCVRVPGVLQLNHSMNNISQGRRMCWRSLCSWFLLFPDQRDAEKAADKRKENSVSKL